jgi:hypothetical protein
VTLTEHITARLAAYVAAADTPAEYRELASRLGALPSLFDMGGCTLIRPDGTLVDVLWDSSERPTETIYRRLRSGAGRRCRAHPELAELLPVRPATARDCAACGGKGRVPLPGPANALCGPCGALGWVEG